MAARDAYLAARELSESQLQEAKKEVYKLKDEVGDSSSAFLLSQQENSRLREALKDLYKAVWDINDQESFPNCGVAECLEDEMRKAKEALNQTDLKE